MTRAERITSLIKAIPELSNYRLELVWRVVSGFSQPWVLTRKPDSDIITETALTDFGDILRLHHSFSKEPFSKDKFEFALEAVMNVAEKKASLAPRGTRGYDIDISGRKYSLKTEAAAAIRADTIHISKFMELGGGKWGNDPEDLKGLRKQFLDNLNGIDRILVLRTLKKGDPEFLYELVEIPKDLLRLAEGGRFEMRLESSQYPKPGYCYIERGKEALFNLYFDGGGERKLQIKGLRKDLCVVHATWQFEVGSQD